MKEKDLSLKSVYDGNDLSVSRLAGEWGIWRFYGEDGDREWLILTDKGMDELADYFANHYAEDKAS